MPRNNDRTDFSAMELMHAFKLYLKEGLKGVERVFPQHKDFVLQHKSKSYQDVKDELLRLELHS